MGGDCSRLPTFLLSTTPRKPHTGRVRIRPRGSETIKWDVGFTLDSYPALCVICLYLEKSRPLGRVRPSTWRERFDPPRLCAAPFQAPNPNFPRPDSPATRTNRFAPRSELRSARFRRARDIYFAGRCFISYGGRGIDGLIL